MVRQVLEGPGAHLGMHGAIFWKFLQKLGRRWAQDGRSWRQVVAEMGHPSAKLVQDGAKIVSFSSTWEVLERFGEHLWVIWAHGLDSEKPYIFFISFSKFFIVFWVVGRDD